MTAPLQSLRARAAYWEKRIECQKGIRRKGQLLRFAWAELARMAITQGVEAYSPEAIKAFEQVMDQSFRVVVNQHGSRPKKSAASRARAAGAGRSRATD